MLAVSRLVDLLARRRLDGHQVVLVSSGAIAAGIGPAGPQSGRATWRPNRPPRLSARVRSSRRISTSSASMA